MNEARDKATVRGWLRDLFSHDASEKLYLSRVATALGYGLKPNDYVKPFPGTPTTIHITEAAQTKTHPLLIGLIVLLLGLILVLVWRFWSSPTSPTPAAAPAPPPQWQLQWEFRDANGQWQPLGDPVTIPEKSQGPKS